MHIIRWTVPTGRDGHWNLSGPASSAGPRSQNGCGRAPATAGTNAGRKSTGDHSGCGGLSLTAVGAFDPLDPIADLCTQYGVWLHVDAAHGETLCLSRKHRHLDKGLHRADSVVLDAHKLRFVPAVCALVFYRNPKHRFRAFEQSAPYLFDPSAPDMSEYDNGMVTFECTKRSAALGLWGTLAVFGTQLFEQLVDHVFATAACLATLLAEIV